ncbi:hypothetical protein T484DRAFT_1837110 [Baffinella frigidus]|nr:hypothetical protein T484DRAFT_1837110 [Cryptophyta sp. CCMP2293]
MRQRYGFPQGTPTRSSKRVKPWGIRAVFSDEQIDTLPDAAPGDGEEVAAQGGFRASGEEVAALGGFRACDTSFGTSSAVTGTIGLTLAAEVTRAIAHGLARAPHIKIRPPEPGSEGLGYRRTAKDDVPQPLSTPADAL